MGNSQSPATIRGRAGQSLTELFTDIGNHWPDSFDCGFELLLSHAKGFSPMLQFPRLGCVHSVSILRAAVGKVISHFQSPFLRLGQSRQVEHS